MRIKPGFESHTGCGVAKWPGVSHLASLNLFPHLLHRTCLFIQSLWRFSETSVIQFKAYLRLMVSIWSMAGPSLFFQNSAKRKMRSTQERHLEGSILISSLKVGSGHDAVLLGCVEVWLYSYGERKECTPKREKRCMKNTITLPNSGFLRKQRCWEEHFPSYKTPD